MSNAPVIVHVTHETVQKIGGIGAVLKGFFTCPAYLNFAGRSIITGPVFEPNLPVSKKLGDDGHLLFSSEDGVSDTNYAQAFAELEYIYNAKIIYGTRSFTDEQTCIQASSLLCKVRTLLSYSIQFQILFLFPLVFTFALPLPTFLGMSSIIVPGIGKVFALTCCSYF